jgi:hypothetical protein
MNIRTDLQYKNGHIVASNKGNADTRKPLPEMALSDRLSSKAWGDSSQQALAKYKLGDHPAISSAISFHKQMVETAERFKNRRSKQSPKDTQYTHLKKLDMDYNAALKQHEQRIKAVQVSLLDAQVNASTQFRERLGFTDRNAPELRERIYNLDSETRSKVISQAIEEKDGNILSAVFDAHPMLSGIDNKQQSAFQTMAMKRHTPELFELDQQADKLFQLVDASFDDLTNITDTMTAKAVLAQYENEILEAEEL